jgi:hypothetical protein
MRAQIRTFHSVEHRAKTLFLAYYLFFLMSQNKVLAVIAN